MNVLITKTGQASGEPIKIDDFTIFNEPLLIINKFKPKINKEKIAAVIITSANACEALARANLDLDTKIFAVGSKTATAAREIGYQNILYPEIASAKNLLKLIYEQKKFELFEGKILYFAGSEVALDFARELNPNYIVEKVLAYEARPIENFSARFLKLSRLIKFDYVAIYSKRGAKAFLELTRKYNLLEYFLSSKMLCISDSVSDCFISTPFTTGKFSELTVLKSVR